MKETVQSGKKREEDMQLDALVRVLEGIGEIVEGCGNKVDVEVVREVDKRLRWARNPEKDPKSALSVVPLGSSRRPKITLIVERI